MTSANSFTDDRYHIAFLGACKVGKTSILNQLVFNKFTHEYEATLETDIDYIANYNDNTVTCLLIDTYGGSDYPAMKNFTISRCKYFLVVFSLTEYESYIEAKRIIKEIKCAKEHESVNIVLVGNKTDLVCLADINLEEIYNYCASLSIDHVHCEFIAVTATDHDDVINMFDMLLRGMGEEENFSKSDTRGRIRSSTIDLPDHQTTDNVTNVSKMNKSPSLYSLRDFSSDGDISLFNYSDGKLNKHKLLFRILSVVDINRRKQRRRSRHYGSF